MAALDEIAKASRVPTPGIDVISPFGLVEMMAGWALTGIMTPAQLLAATNNYAPVDATDTSILLDAVTVLRLSTDASRAITGLVAPDTSVYPRKGAVKLIVNVGSFDVVLTTASASSTEANRFAFAASITLTPNQSQLLWYDVLSARWRAA